MTVFSVLDTTLAARCRDRWEALAEKSTEKPSPRGTVVIPPRTRNAHFGDRKRVIRRVNDFARQKKRFFFERAVSSVSYWRATTKVAKKAKERGNRPARILATDFARAAMPNRPYEFGEAATAVGRPEISCTLFYERTEHVIEQILLQILIAVLTAAITRCPCGM